MSESNVQLFKLQERQYDVESDLYKKLGDLQDLRKRIADLNKGKAKDNREREQHLLKKAEFEEKGLADKAYKSETKALKQDAQIAKKNAKINDLERRIKLVEEDIEKLEVELSEAEADVNAHETGSPVDEPENNYQETYEDTYEPAVLDDPEEDEFHSEPVDDLSYQE
jgi:chromosome segregation ATPase